MRFKRHAPHEKVARAVAEAFLRGKILERTCPKGYTACANGMSSASSSLGFDVSLYAYHLWGIPKI